MTALFIVSLGTAMLPSVFTKDSMEDLVDLKGALMGISVSKHRDPAEAVFTFSVKGHPKLFSVTGLMSGDAALLATEKRGNEFRFTVERRKYEDAALSRVPVLSLVTDKNTYIQLDSFAFARAKFRLFGGFFSLACYVAAFLLFRNLRRKGAAGEIDSLAISSARWLRYVGLRPRWARAALDYEEEREEKLGKRVETPKSNHAKAVMLLIQKGSVDVQNEFGQSALHVAAAAGHVEAVDLLLRNGAKVDLSDKEGNTPLLVASQGSSLGVVTRLLQNGASVLARNKSGLNALEYHDLGKKKDKVIRDLLDKTVQQQKALIEAAKTNYGDALSALCKSGAYVNMLDEAGVLPLAHAIRAKALESVKRLIQNGAHVDEEILKLAHRSGHPEIATAVNAAYEKAQAKEKAQAAYKAKNQAG